MKHTYKFLTSLLGIAMLAGFLMATPAKIIIALGPVCEIVETGLPYDSLADALAAHTDGETIKFLDDIDHTGSIYVNGKTLILDLDGYDLNVNVSGSYVPALGATNGATVTVNGDITVAALSGDVYGVYASGSGAELTVNGNVTVSGTGNYDVIGVGTQSTGEVHVTGDVTVNATASTVTGVASYSGVTVDGDVIVSGTGNIIGVTINNSEVTIGGGIKVSGTGNITGVSSAIGNATTNIDGEIYVPAGESYILFGSTLRNIDDIKIPSGKTGYREYVPLSATSTSRVWVKKAMIPVSGAVCEIAEMGIQYTSLEDAMAAFNKPFTITLLCDINYTTPLSLSSAFASLVTFDLNGYTLTVNCGTSITAVDMTGHSLTLNDSSGGGEFKVTGNVIGDMISFYDGIKADIDGNLLSVIKAQGSDTSVHVTGNVEYDSVGETNFVWADDGAVIDIEGNVTIDELSKGSAVMSEHEAKITVGGNVLVKESDYAMGAAASSNGTVMINGNVTFNGDDDCAGANSNTGGEITIDGVMKVTGKAAFIWVGAEIKTATQNDASSTKTGYKQYSDTPSGSDPKSYVWIKLGSYTLSVNAGTGGSVSGTASGVYTEGTAISVTAVPNSGYRFTGWTVNGITLGSSTVNPAAFNMPTNAVTMTANFEEIFTLTVINGSGSGLYSAGTTVTIIADTAPSGMEFDKWVLTSGNGTFGNSKNKTTSFTMTVGNATVTATYKNPEAVNTGDDRNITLVLGLCLTAMLGLGITLKLRKREESITL